MKAKVYVTLKREVLDPQGEAIARALGSLGLQGVEKVRVGKLIELDLTDRDPEMAKKELRDMGEKLLANAVIEDFRVEV